MTLHGLVLEEICCEYRVIHNVVEIDGNKAFTGKAYNYVIAYFSKLKVKV